MEQKIVGKIDGYDVIYIPDKDMLFCKNTTMPYLTMRKALIDNPIDRMKLKNGLMMQNSNEIVKLACLTTTIENCRQINLNIKKIRKNGNRKFSKSSN
jgi:hypothetical protein